MADGVRQPRVGITLNCGCAEPKIRKELEMHSGIKGSHLPLHAVAMRTTKGEMTDEQGNPVSMVKLEVGALERGYDSVR